MAFSVEAQGPVSAAPPRGFGGGAS